MMLGSGRMMAGVASAVVAIAVGAGLYIAGPPSQARLESQDSERMRRLWRAEQAIRSYQHERGFLPPQLAEVRPEWSTDSSGYRDPVTGAPFPYRIVNDSTYTLCAVFSKAKEDEYGNVEQGHPAGEHCFTRHISSEPPPPH